MSNIERSLRIVLLVVTLGVSVFLLLAPIDLGPFEIPSYAGVFVITLLNSATVLLPFPGMAIVVLAGRLLNPIWVGLLAGAGSAIGEIGGYLSGVGGRALAPINSKWYVRLEKWMLQHGSLTIFILALIPNPLFDLAGIAAGTMAFPIRRFFLACLLGKTIRSLIYAHFGSMIERPI